jgi:predicted AAA+ superfamily ATPase
VDGWESFLRRLLDSEDMQLAVTGSSARLLSREIATSLRGRALATEIFPFSFREALRFQGVALTDQPPGGNSAHSSPIACATTYCRAAFRKCRASRRHTGMPSCRSMWMW